MQKNRVALALAMAFPIIAAAQEAPSKSLGVVVTVAAGQPTSLPTQIPTTMEGVTREQIEQTDQRDRQRRRAQVLPQPAGAQALHRRLQPRHPVQPRVGHRQQRALGRVRRRHPAVQLPGQRRRRPELSAALGHGHARGDRARRRDVRPVLGGLPRQLGRRGGRLRDPHAHPVRGACASWAIVSQPFELYNTNDTFRAWQASASVGNKAGDWAWWLNFNHTDSDGQPLTFATRLVSTGAPGTAGTPVTGAVLDKNNTNAPIVRPGHRHRSTTPSRTTSRSSWPTTSRPRCARPTRSACGRTRPQGRPVILPAQRGRAAGLQRRRSTSTAAPSAPLTGGDFALTNESLTHFMHGLSVKSHTRGVFDWEVAASLYDYSKDEKRQNGAGTVLPAAADRRRRHAGRRQRHRLEHAGAQGHLAPRRHRRAAHRGLRLPAGQLQAALPHVQRPGDWIAGAPAGVASNVGGKTRLQSLYAQDAWALRAEVEDGAGRPRRVVDGQRRPDADSSARRRRSTRVGPSAASSIFSPKAALSYQWAARHGAQGLGRSRGAHADGGRAVRRDVDDQLAVHQRPESQAGEVVDRPN